MKLPEIGLFISHSTEVPEGFQKLNNNMSNFNSDPYALRIKPPSTTQKHAGPAQAPHQETHHSSAMGAPSHFNKQASSGVGAAADPANNVHYNTASQH